MFQGALLFAQKYPNLCTLKEQNKKLYLTVEDVASVKRSAEVLTQIENLIQFPEVLPSES
jgi:hypothetical protein